LSNHGWETIPNDAVKKDVIIMYHWRGYTGESTVAAYWIWISVCQLSNRTVI